MQAEYMVFAVAMIIVDQIIKRAFPEFYKRMELPMLVLFTLLAVGYCGLLVYALYQVIVSGVTTGDKVFFVIFIGVNVSAFIAMIVFSWRDMLKKKRK